MATKTQILISARDGASAVFGKVARSSTRAQKKVFGVNNALQSTDKSMKALSGSVKGLAAGAAGVFGLGALAASLKDAVAIKVEYDKINNVLKAVTGSSSKAAAEFGFLSEEAERLGIQLRPLAQSYTRLSAAGQLLGLTTADTREIFTSFSEALTGFGATREQSIRVFTAIEQILSKGKVSAEELRQQLGEALPGSFQLAAKAAGVTVQELDGMLKRGELLSSEFILPFAKAVRTQFGGAAVEGAKLLNAEFSRTINVLDKVKLAIVEGGDAGDSLADTLARILKDFREFIGNEDRLKSFADAGRTLGTGLELAAKSIQTIATVISKIPSEALIALGAIALGGSRTKGASAAAIQALSPVIAAPIAQRSAFDTIRGQRNFLPSVAQGGINDSNLREVQRILGARSQRSAIETAITTSNLGSIGALLGSKFNKLEQATTPKSLITPSKAFSGQFGQQKLAEGFQKTFVPAVEKANKSIKERLAPTLNKVSAGMTKVGGAFKSLGAQLLGVFSPVNLLIGGLGVLAGKFLELKEEQKKLVLLQEKGAKTQATTIALNAAMRQNRAGTFDFAQAVADAKTRANELGLTITQELVNVIEKSINKGREARKKQIEAGGAEDKKAIEQIFAFTDQTSEILAYAEAIRTLGLERAKENLQVKELAGKIQKEKNLTEQESLELAKDRIAAEKQVQDAIRKSFEDKRKAEEAEAARKKKVKESAEAAKKAATSLRDFNKETNNIQKENTARARGVSEEAIENARRQREYKEALEASGVATEQATKAARDRVAAENEKAKAERQRQLIEGTRATGRATSALSSAARLKDQERANKRLVLEQIKAQKAAAAKKLQQEKKQQQEKKREELETKKNTTDMKEALTDIRDILNSYNTSFA